MEILGALIEIEVPVKETNRRPDFIARFPDGAVTVEATVPEINESVNRQMSWNEELVEIIEALTPDDWSVEVWRLPTLGPNDSKKDFKRTVKKMFEELPSQARLTDDSIRIEMESGFDGELALTLKPGRKGKRAAPVRGMVSGADDTEQRIRAAVTRKKKQVKKANTPVLLAVRTDAFGGWEDYDKALYGLTYKHVDLSGKTVRTGFDPVGVFGKKRREPPTCARVLAFTEVGFPRVSDPVAYMHPRYDGVLPDSLMSLEVRTLEGTGVHVQPARMKKILAELELVY